jgi:hypothetical protein
VKSLVDTCPVMVLADSAVAADMGADTADHARALTASALARSCPFHGRDAPSPFDSDRNRLRIRTATLHNKALCRSHPQEESTGRLN